MEEVPKELVFQELADEYRITVGEVLTLELKEQSVVGMGWECKIPEGMVMVDKYTKYEGLMDIVYWRFVGEKMGQYELLFEYRKQCCGHYLKEDKAVSVWVEDQKSG